MAVWFVSWGAEVCGFWVLGRCFLWDVEEILEGFN